MTGLLSPAWESKPHCLGTGLAQPWPLHVCLQSEPTEVSACLSLCASQDRNIFRKERNRWEELKFWVHRCPHWKPDMLHAPGSAFSPSQRQCCTGEMPQETRSWAGACEESRLPSQPDVPRFQAAWESRGHLVGTGRRWETDSWRGVIKLVVRQQLGQSTMMLPVAAAAGGNPGLAGADTKPVQQSRATRHTQGPATGSLAASGLALGDSL